MNISFCFVNRVFFLQLIGFADVVIFGFLVSRDVADGGYKYLCCVVSLLRV